MFLSKSSSGIWYVYYTGVDGKTKRSSTRCKLKTDALKFLQTFKPEHTAKPKTVFLSDFITEFLSFAETNYSRGTRYIYKFTLEKFAEMFDNISLSSITPQHWDKYKAGRLKSKNTNFTKDTDSEKCVSPITVNIELRTLRAAMFTALRWKLIENNPFSRQSLCSIPEKTPLFFTKEDFQKLIVIIQERWLKELVIFATLTGMRRGELVNLRWNNVDLPRKTITIESNPTFKTKFGRKRVLPLNDTAVYILQQKAVKSIGEYVFTVKGKKVSGNWLTLFFKWYVRECKLTNKGLHLHSLRHTFASWLVQDGVSLYEVQKLLGHSNIAVTQVYCHLQPEQLHSTVNKIQIALN